MRTVAGARYAAFIAALAAIGGCAETITIPPTDYHLSYNLPLQDRATLSRLLPESELQDVSTKIYLISDNQRHEVLGGGVNWFRSSASDVQTKVAIRPPQLDLFGQDLIREALGTVDGFVLHLGDACDISNTGEFGRFAWDMQHASNGWVMAPGNHDGFFFGNSSRTKQDLIDEWNESGESYEINGMSFKSQAMQKDRFVSYYLAALILQDDVWSGQLARELGAEKYLARWADINLTATVDQPVTFAQYWTELVALQEQIYNVASTADDQTYSSFELTASNPAIDRPHLRRIAWQIDKDKVWRSFILQEVDISVSSAAAANVPERTSILVIDTAHYGVQPSLDHGIPSGILHKLTFGNVDYQVAGVHGNILDSQESAARTFADAMQAEQRRWILATHHPYSDLGRATPPRFNNVRDAGGIPVTLSGHTHSGEIRLNLDEERQEHFLEINVGSLLDSPIEFRDLQVHRVGDRLAISSNRYLMENLLRDRKLMADQLPGYRPSPGDPDYYLAYTQEDGFEADHDITDFRIKRLILAAYLRMFRLFEADHPDQSSTYWPIGADGKQLRSHKEVTDAMQDMLVKVQIADIDDLNRFLYQLQEFDRTRRFSEAGVERLRAYRLSQAIWASRTEQRVFEGGTTAIDPDISFLILPN
jgi:hypothetical protein